jgi:hypothetical protein
MLSTGREYGTITDTMNIVRTQRQGTHLNTLEKYHIYEISKNNLQKNDTDIDTHNPTFRALQKRTPGNITHSLYLI